MSKLIFVFLLFSSSCFADPWTREDSYREATYLTFHVIDWAQTRGVAKNEWPDGRYEANKFLGKHPTVFEVDRYMAITALAHVGVAKLLNNEWRSAFQYLTIGFEGGVVLRNFKAGVHIRF